MNGGSGGGSGFDMRCFLLLDYMNIRCMVTWFYDYE